MKNFISLGVLWTVTMFLMFNIVFPYVSHAPITLKLIIENTPLWLVGLPIWISGGIIYTTFMKQKETSTGK